MKESIVITSERMLEIIDTDCREGAMERASSASKDSLSKGDVRRLVELDHNVKFFLTAEGCIEVNTLKINCNFNKA